MDWNRFSSRIHFKTIERFMSDHWNSLANLLGTPNLKPRSKKSREEDVSTAPQSTPATTPNPAALHEEVAAATPTPPAPTSKPRGGRGASKKQVADQGAKEQSPVEHPEIQSFGGDLVSEETPAVQPEESKRGSRRSPRGNENRGSEKGGNEKGEGSEPSVGKVLWSPRNNPLGMYRLKKFAWSLRSNRKRRFSLKWCPKRHLRF